MLQYIEYINYIAIISMGGTIIEENIQLDPLITQQSILDEAFNKLLAPLGFPDAEYIWECLAMAEVNAEIAWSGKRKIPYQFKLDGWGNRSLFITSALVIKSIPLPNLLPTNADNDQQILITVKGTPGTKRMGSITAIDGNEAYFLSHLDRKGHMDLVQIATENSMDLDQVERIVRGSMNSLHQRAANLGFSLEPENHGLFRPFYRTGH
jgi:hypothetical protein